MSSYKPTHLFLDAPRRCIRRTTTDCRPYRSSHAECHLVAVEVVGLLAVFAVFGLPISNLCLRFLGIRETNPVYSSRPSEASPSFRRPLPILLPKAS